MDSADIYFNSHSSFKSVCSSQQLSTRSINHEGNWLSRSLLTVSKSAGELLKNSNADLMNLQIEAFTPSLKPSTNKSEIRKPTSPGYDVPDQGYAWVVLISATLCNILAIIPLYASGVFYTILVEEFGYPITLSWVISSQAALYCAAGPLAAVVVKLTSARVAMLIGQFGLVVSLLISSRATSVPVLFIFFGIFAGFFASLIFVPASVYPRKYFVRRITMALSVTALGTPTVFLVMVPIIKEVMMEFGWRNAAVFLAAIYMQSMVAGMLMREPRFCPEDEKMMINSRGDSMRSRVTLYNSWQTVSHSTSQMSVDHDHTELRNVQHPAVRVFDADQFSSVIPETVEDETTGETEEDKLKHNLDTIQEGVVWRPDDAEAGFDLGEPENTPAPTRRGSADGKLGSQSNISTKIDRHGDSNTSCYSALCNVGFLTFVFVYFLWGTGSSMFFLLLPDYLEERGIRERNVSILYIIMGIGSLCSRAAVCIMSAKIEYNMLVLAAAAYLLQAVTMLGIVILDQFSVYIVFSTIFSMAAGAIAILPGPILHQMIGDEQHMELAFGLAHFTFGIGTLLSTPIPALTLKLQGSYDPGMMSGSALIFVSAACYLAMSVRQYYRTKKLASTNH